jgi:hypothetical protein
MLASQLQDAAKTACTSSHLRERHPNTKYSKAAAKAGAKRVVPASTHLLIGDVDID